MMAAGGGCCLVYLLSVSSPSKGCPYLALYMQPGRVYMSCLVLQVVASLGFTWAARWASKYIFSWAASGMPMVGCPEGMPTSVTL